jgi:hypothetical protein
LGVESFVGHQDAHGDGEVEPRTALAQPAGRQVDRDALVGPVEPGGQHSGAYSVARLSARLVGQTHDLERGQTGTDVYLDGDGLPGDPEHRGRTNGCEHGASSPERRRNGTVVAMRKHRQLLWERDGDGPSTLLGNLPEGCAVATRRPQLARA